MCRLICAFVVRIWPKQTEGLSQFGSNGYSWTNFRSKVNSKTCTNNSLITHHAEDVCWVLQSFQSLTPNPANKRAAIRGSSQCTCTTICRQDYFFKEGFKVRPSTQNASHWPTVNQICKKKFQDFQDLHCWYEKVWKNQVYCQLQTSLSPSDFFFLFFFRSFFFCSTLCISTSCIRLAIYSSVCCSR